MPSPETAAQVHERRQKAETRYRTALMHLALAVDSRGLYVVLAPASAHAMELRERTKSFAEFIAHHGWVMLPDTPAGDANYYRNLALLANATAAAIEYEAAT